jgi:replicative DNA helicase
MNLEKTEQAFIGSLMIYGQELMVYAITANVASDWFSNYVAQGIWDWTVSRFKAGKHYGAAEAFDWIKKPENKEWLHAALELAVVPALAVQQMTELRGAWLKRRGSAVIQKAGVDLQASDDPDTQLCSTAKELLEIARTQDADMPIAEVALRQYETWKDRKATTHLYWPLKKMQQTYGFIETDLICLLASPGCGKSAFAIQCAVEWASKGHRVAIKSLESRKPQVSGRLATHIGKVNVARLRKGEARDDEKESYLAACEKMKTLPIDVDDRPADIGGVFAWAVMAKQRGAKALILDNLKHIRGNTKKDTVEQFRELFLGCKWIRDDVDLPMMVLHHTNADGDAAWSKDIERDADVMLHMNTVAKENPGQPDEHILVEFEFRKYRDDASGTVVRTEFKRRTQTFEER